MFKKIELDNTFKHSLEHGINLFLGSAFSLLSQNMEGNPLPTGGQLCNELTRFFKQPPGLNLPQLCTILESNKKEQLYSFLKKRFLVNSYDERYNCLTKFKINAIFTTNIDNLVYKIYSENDTYYINDLAIRGPILGDLRVVNYIPLHGSVLNDERPLIFNVADIGSAFGNDRDTWQFLRESVMNTPTLFWGYSLSDAGVIQALFQNPNLASRHKDKWITLLEEDEATNQYFRALGFNIINADTEGMLDYLNAIEKPTQDSIKTIIKTHKKFPNESIPAIQDVPVRPLLDFYHGAAPIWSDIFTGRIYKTSFYREIVDLIHSQKHVMVLGIPASGKTTLLLQISSEIDFKGHKLVVADLTLEKAKLIVKRLGDEKALIFIDNFTDDIEAINLLLNLSNIQLVLFEREHNYEIISHRIVRNQFSVINITDLRDSDVQEIYNRIPPEIRKKTLISPNNQKSLFEFICLNVQTPSIRERLDTLIRELENDKTKDYIDFFIMCCYVHSCRTPVSYDMAYAFLRNSIEDYSRVYEIKNKLGSLIKEYIEDYIDDKQDYFSARSSIVSETILNQVPSSILKRVLYRFYENISPLRISRYDVFKRKAFDHSFIERAFPNWREGKAFYEMLYSKDSSPHMKQQGALYLASKGIYVDAFSWIDEAILNSENKIFSIRNSHAVILFDANIAKHESDGTVRGTLDKSMKILEACYKNDRRKAYHATRFATQAIKYYSRYADEAASKYLKTAYEWLLEEKTHSPWNKDIIKQVGQIKHILN